MIPLLTSVGVGLLPVRRVLGSVPTWAWLALGIALAGLLGAWWHHHEVKKHDTAVIAARDAQWNKRLEAEHASALNWKAKFDADEAKMAAESREKQNEKVAAVGAVGADLMRVGSGKARCGQGDYSGPPARSSRPQPSVGAGTATVAQVPSAAGVDLIGLPFNDAVRFAGQADLNRDEAQRWRDWYAQLVKAWPKP